MSDQKENIISTRIGGLGSSDAAMCYNIGIRGFLTQSDNFRIAVMLGIEQPIQFSNSGTRIGDEIEETLFNYLKAMYPNILSNPYFKSDVLSENYRFDVFNHIDYEIEDETSITWFENKAVVTNIDDTISHYFYQICWHKMLLDEKAKLLNKIPYLKISHYDTNDFTSVEEMSIDKWNMRIIENEKISFAIDVIKKGLQIISDTIPTFVYVKQEILDANILPNEQVKLMNDIAIVINQIESQNNVIENFKSNMYELMKANNIKSIKHDSFTLTVVDETVSVSFDSKAFKVKHPDLYSQFTKSSPKKGYLKITTKNEK